MSDVELLTYDTNQVFFVLMCRKDDVFTLECMFPLPITDYRPIWSKYLNINASDADYLHVTVGQFVTVVFVTLFEEMKLYQFDNLTGNYKELNLPQFHESDLLRIAFNDTVLFSMISYNCSNIAYYDFEKKILNSFPFSIQTKETSAVENFQVCNRLNLVCFGMRSDIEGFYIHVFAYVDNKFFETNRIKDFSIDFKLNDYVLVSCTPEKFLIYSVEALAFGSDVPSKTVSVDFTIGESTVWDISENLLAFQSPQIAEFINIHNLRTNAMHQIKHEENAYDIVLFDTSVIFVSLNKYRSILLNFSIMNIVSNIFRFR